MISVNLNRVRFHLYSVLLSDMLSPVFQKMWRAIAVKTRQQLGTRQACEKETSALYVIPGLIIKMQFRTRCAAAAALAYGLF